MKFNIMLILCKTLMLIVFVCKEKDQSIDELAVSKHTKLINSWCDTLY